MAVTMGWMVVVSTIMARMLVTKTPRTPITVVVRARPTSQNTTPTPTTNTSANAHQGVRVPMMMRVTTQRSAAGGMRRSSAMVTG